jgi:transposase
MQGESHLLREKVILKEKIIKELLIGSRKHKEAAHELGVTPRTIHNYLHRFLEHGSEGLKDRRKGGNHRKLTPAEEAAIVAFKQERPHRSTRLIRDRLGLSVSEEAVRLILVKHNLNKKALVTSNSNGQQSRPDA